MTETYLGYSDGWHSLLNDAVTPYGGIAPSGIFGDPGAGHVYYGINIGANNSTNGYLTRESQFGHRMGCVRSYFDWSSLSSAVAQASSDLTAGRIPILSVKVGGLGGTNAGWDNFAAGTGDSTFNTFLSNLNALHAGPILLCLHHEPNGDGAAASYLAMCRHAKTMTDAYPQILLVGGFMATSFYYTDAAAGPHLNIPDWIQDDSCDMPGIDIYNAADSPSETNWQKWSKNSATTLAQIASVTSKPIVVGEWGLHTWTPDPTLSTTYMSDFYTWALQNAYAVAYFDAVGTLSTQLDAHGAHGAIADTESGPPWVRYDKFGTQLADSRSLFIPPGGIHA